VADATRTPDGPEVGPSHSRFTHFYPKPFNSTGILTSGEIMGRESSTGYSRDPDPLLVALVTVAAAVIAIVVVMMNGL
jgi:hypothetical protein